MLNPEEEKKFAELRDKCKDLKVPPPPDVHIGFQVHKDGKLIFDDKQRGHSWTRNFYNFRAGIGTNGTLSGSFGVGSLIGKNISGNNNSNLLYITEITAGVVGALRGIVVGTGDTAWSMEQYALVAPIANGTGSGKLTYQASGYDSKSYASKIWTMTSKRIINNNSGGSITIKEVGLYSDYGCNTFLTERSVLAPVVPVANSAQLTVTYEISMDFSSID